MDDVDPKGWLETVTLLGSDIPVRVRLEEREGKRVFLRQVDPNEENPPRVPIFEGDELIVLAAYSHTGLHTTPEPGPVSDLVHSMRIVPLRREGSTVYARTLRHGEEDDGRRVHVRPGDNLVLESVAVELDAIDANQESTESGYVPLTSVLSAWFSTNPQSWPEALIRYALAAARRLDMANELLIRVRAIEDEVNANPDLPGPQIRRGIFTVVGNVELAVISLGRAIAMIASLPDKFALAHDIPQTLTDCLPALQAIRNAYEHIEDRAFGTVRDKESPVALSIFDYRDLLANDRIIYGEHTLDLAEEVPALLATARAALKGMCALGPPEIPTAGS